MSVTFPTGFRAAGVTAGFKPSGLPDLGLLVGDPGTTAAGVFTTNLVSAAPVRLSRARLALGAARAVLVNSGQANAATGARGDADAATATAAAAAALGLDAADVLQCSTGVIGEPLHLAAARRGVTGARGRTLARGRRGLRPRDHDHRHRRQARDRRGGRDPRRRLREGCRA